MFRKLTFAVAFMSLVSMLSAASQLYPTKKSSGKLSAFLIKPTEGVEKLPKGWSKTTSPSFGNCAIANEALFPAKGAKSLGVIQTVSYELPKSNYLVSVCVRGVGKARLKGHEKWTDINVKPGNYYRWVELGEAKDVEQVVVEVSGQPGKSFYYGGVLAEGDVMPVVSVAKVWEKIQGGGPVTVALLGDSVTENFGGKGGGSSKFETGNPGLMKAFLEKASGRSVDYIAHREPQNWPKLKDTRSRIRNADPAAWPEIKDIPTMTIGEKKYTDARQKMDAGKKVHLINLGKGGADSKYSWSRMPETAADNDYRINAKALAANGLQAETVRYGLGYYKPDLVIINFGTNDNNGAHLKWTVDDYLFHTRCAATNIQQRFGAAVILATPHKWTRGLHLKHHWQPQLVDRLRDFCKRSGLRLADIYIEYPLGEGDGIHPGDKGHARMVKAYTHAIKGEAQSPASKPTVMAADLKDNGDGTVTNAKAKRMMVAAPNALGEATSKEEAEAIVKKMNEEKTFGYTDWRLGKKEELFGMIDQSQRPAVVKGAPFKNLDGYYYLDAGGIDLTVGMAHGLGRRGNPKTGHVFPVRDVK